MGWVSGTTIGAYLESHYKDSSRIALLAENFRTCLVALESLQVAHGDLQHGNIMVSPSGAIKLIDYDGMYVPGMSRGGGHETGHINYQHPQRVDGTYFGPSMDRFSAMCIYTALLCIKVNPGLWEQFNNGDNILFQRADFLPPFETPLLTQLRQMNGVPQIPQLLHWLRSNLDDLPSYVDFISGKQFQASTVSPAPRITPKLRQYDLLNGMDSRLLLSREGDTVEVLAKVMDVYSGIDKRGNEYQFLNAGDHRAGCFTVVIWPGVLKTFKGYPAFEGKWIRVVGLLMKNAKRNSYQARPEIHLERFNDIKILDQAQAFELGASIMPSSELSRFFPKYGPNEKQFESRALSGVLLQSRRPNTGASLGPNSARVQQTLGAAMNQVDMRYSPTRPTQSSTPSGGGLLSSLWRIFFG